VPRHVTRLVTRIVARLVARLVAPLVVDYSVSRRLVVDYFTSIARPGASARRAARHADRRAARCRLLRLAKAHRRQLRLAQARHRLLCPRHAFGCLGTSRGSSRRSSRGSSRRSSRGSSSTTSPTPRVWVPRHVARIIALLVVDYSVSHRLVVDYFASAACPGASARRAARHAARRAAHRRLLHVAQARRELRLAQARHRLLRLRRASGCLGTSRASSRGSSLRLSSTTPCREGSLTTTSRPPHVRVPRHVARLVIDYSASRRLVVGYFAYAARPADSARRAAHHAHRRVTRRRLLRLRRASR
jgi:hypothetical protein